MIVGGGDLAELSIYWAVKNHDAGIEVIDFSFGGSLSPFLLILNNPSAVSLPPSISVAQSLQ